MLNIGYRTTKTALGTAISISIAQLLGLQNFASAGILTILCIKVTKKKSLKSSWDRLLACTLGIIFSTVFFELIAYHPITIGVMLLLFIPTLVKVKAQDGLVTSSVIILHLYTAQQVTFGLVLNEFALILIGIGVALIMNLYMPSVDKKLVEYQKRIEENFTNIFMEIEKFILTKDTTWDGKQITETAKLLSEAKTVAFRNVENHFKRNEDLYYRYFQMREKQFEIIERVLPSLTAIQVNVEQGKMVADFIAELRENIHPGNTANKFLKKLFDMKNEFQESPLPTTREEFEVRAALFHFIREMEQYLVIKSMFKGIKYKKKTSII